MTQEEEPEENPTRQTPSHRAAVGAGIGRNKRQKAKGNALRAAILTFDS